MRERDVRGSMARGGKPGAVVGRLLPYALLAMTIALVACGNSDTRQEGGGTTQEPLVADLGHAVSQLEARIDSLERVDAVWQMGDASSVVSAFFDGAALRVINEKMDTGNYSSAVHKYYFDDRALFCYLRSEARAAAAPEGEGDVDEITMQLFFDGRGELLFSEKTRNGKKVDLDEHDVPEVMAHVAQLRAVLLDSEGRRRDE